MRLLLRIITLAGFAFVAWGAGPAAYAQPAPPAPMVSPEVRPGGQLVFRIKAPDARSVQLQGDPLGVAKESIKATKRPDGVWEIAAGPVAPGSYRYNFNLDGLVVIDPHNPLTSESNNRPWSLVHVPGAASSDIRNVPHGAVSQVTYHSTSLGRVRRLHVYTPPGYGSSTARYPVFYLLHGSSDSDNAWTSIGRAGVILDNLIADKKAKPMIVVMPHGHTAAVRTPANNDEFTRDFLTDVMPLVEKSYRVHADRPHRAIAGLSMGGGQTLTIAVPHLDKFAYIGVFSSSMPGMRRNVSAGQPAPPAPPPGPSFEEKNKATLENPALKKGLKLLWIGTGKDDAGAENTRKTVETFKKYGFAPVYKESEGGHTWANWRDYLTELAPRLFAAK